MRHVIRKTMALAVFAAMCGALVVAMPAQAKTLKAITARVPAAYRLVAMSKTGELTVGTVTKGVTTVVPSSSTVTLHLVSRNGAYAGPIVVGTKKVGKQTRAILGVKAGASLGRVTYRRAGYGIAKVSASSIVPKTFANASAAGAPYGAGSLGFISTVAKKTVATFAVRAVAVDDGLVGSDPDKDGIPNAVDVDDNGDGSLDVVDEKTMAANAGKSGPRPYIFSDFFVDLVDIIRVSDAATASATKEIVKQKLKFVFGSSKENGAIQNVRIDCLGIAWCSSATVFAAPGAPTVNWSAVDKDGDGRFFDLDTRVVGMNTNFDSSIKPNVYPVEVQPGQMFNFELKYAAGKQVIIPSALTTFFVTAPAPSRIGATTITYPVPAGTGTFTNPIATGSGTNLRIETSRPMRPVMPSESEAAGMKEMGNLKYWITLSPTGASMPPTSCAADSYSSMSSNLTLIPNGPQPMMKDTSADSSPSQPSMVAFSVDLAKCNVANVAAGTKFLIDLNVGDAANNHSVANFYVVVS